MTTLGAGAVVLIATFMRDIFPKAEDGTLLLSESDKYFLSMAMLLFGGTVGFAVSMLMTAAAFKIKSSTLAQRFLRWGTVLVVYSFAIGILVFGYIAQRAVYQQ